MSREIVYAKLGTESFIAGVSLDAIVRDAERICPDTEIVPVERSQIPKSYDCSIDDVICSQIWRKVGTYLLIRGFERYEHSSESSLTKD